VIALWGAERFYLSGRRGESVLDYRGRTAIASAAIQFGERRRAERGAIDEEYRRALFSRPLDASFYEAYCALMRLPMPTPSSARLPEEFAGLAATSEVRKPARSGGAIAASTWVALGTGVALGGGSGLLFLLGESAADDVARAVRAGRVDEDAEARRAGFRAAGAATAVGAAVSLMVGGALLSMDLTAPSPVIAVGPGSASVGLAGAF
ncbi:MAG: hypothetical protein ACK4N5_18535, partial [Myxococcales bacterium]